MTVIMRFGHFGIAMYFMVRNYKTGKRTLVSMRKLGDALHGYYIEFYP